MLPSHISPDWTSDDAVALRVFLETNTGQKMLHSLADLAPSLLDGRDNGMTLVASGKVAGYTEAINNLVSLVIEPPKPQTVHSDAYPSLEDDAAWAGTETSEK